jgi:hypothetical protein
MGGTVDKSDSNNWDSKLAGTEHIEQSKGEVG